jgi:hypothetical protein
MTREPFSFAVLVRDIPAEGRRFSFAADDEQRRDLAPLLAIPAVSSLRAELEVRPAMGGAFRVRGTITASVVQTDVVTLEPIEQEIVEEIDMTLMEAEDVAPSRKGSKQLVDTVEVDGPDLYHNGRIDLGIIVREHLALALDPYPRAPGVDFPGHIEDDPAADPSPFAVLGTLKARGE